MFLAYNKSANKTIIAQKAEMLTETLASLPDDKIKPFFAYVRATDDVMPTDGRLKVILRSTYKKFTNYQPDAQQVEYDAKLTNNDRLLIKYYADKYPDFEDLFLESLQDDNLYPPKDWHSRFMKRLMAPSVLGRLGEIQSKYGHSRKKEYENG